MSNELNIQVNRKVWDWLWAATLGAENLGANDGRKFENEIFVCDAYDWSDDAEQPYNFWHKPSGFKISWYKYALRGAWCNMEITDAQFVDILEDCLGSYRSTENCKVNYCPNKWWDCDTCFHNGNSEACSECKTKIHNNYLTKDMADKIWEDGYYDGYWDGANDCDDRYDKHYGLEEYVENDYDPCDDCTAYGDDYYQDDNGEWVSACDSCMNNECNWEDEQIGG